MNIKTKLFASAVVVVVAMTTHMRAAQATVYTSDSSLADLTAGITVYATFSNYTPLDPNVPSPPFTPNSAGLAADSFRVYNGDDLTMNGIVTHNQILATFSSPVPYIRVFPSIDHFNFAYDGFQYSIAGSNDLSTWTPLFNALMVVGSGEPFTLGTFTGTAPLIVNNVLTPSTNCRDGCIGYEADFLFADSYRYYAFGPSTFAIAKGNADQELSAVGTVPEPEIYAMLGIGLALMGFVARRRQGQAAAA